MQCFEGYKIIDLSHTITSQSPTWTGDCGFRNKVVLDYAHSATETNFRVQQFSMNAGIGTHIDAPAHCFPGAETVDNLALTTLITPCVVINVAAKANENYQINLEDIQIFEHQYGMIAKNALVIFHTGWSKFWSDKSKYINNHHFPSVAKVVAEILLEREVCGLAIDTLSPDCPGSIFPVHQLMLGASKYIIENIAHADALPPVGACVIALPLKIKNATEAPLRMIGLVKQENT